VTAWCQAGAEWTAHSPGKTYLSVGGTPQLAPATGLGRQAAHAVRAGTITAILRAQQFDERMAEVAYAPRGQTMYQAYDASIPPLALVDRIRQTLLIAPERTRLGFVALLPVSAYSWSARGKALPPLPTVPAHALRRNPPIWQRYVLDAHACQRRVNLGSGPLSVIELAPGSERG
jgi:hypothetical protein